MRVKGDSVATARPAPPPLRGEFTLKSFPLKGHGPELPPTLEAVDVLPKRVDDRRRLCRDEYLYRSPEEAVGHGVTAASEPGDVRKRIGSVATAGVATSGASLAAPARDGSAAAHACFRVWRRWARKRGRCHLVALTGKEVRARTRACTCGGRASRRSRMTSCPAMESESPSKLI